MHPNRPAVRDLTQCRLLCSGNRELHRNRSQRRLLPAFPDLNITIEDQIAEGDKVVTRWVGRGTQQGELQGIPPTGKQATTSGIAIDRIVSGKLVETWDQFDALGMMQQLGVVPTPEQVGV
jgi:predicted ester cyclase